MAQSSVDFATVASKLLPNVKITHIGEVEIQSNITKLDPWNIVCETLWVSKSHIANSTGSVIKTKLNRGLQRLSLETETLTDFRWVKPRLDKLKGEIKQG